MNSKNIPQQLEHYFIQVGQVVWAWNHMQSDFYFIFEAELDKNDMAAKALWDKCPSDFAQRQLLMAIMEGSEDNKYKECIYWALKAADNLSSYRNAIVHVRILPQLESFLPNQVDEYLKSRDIRRLEGDNLIFAGDAYTSKDKHTAKVNDLIDNDKFENLVTDILTISRFLQMLWWSQAHGFLPPFDSLPEIPLLKTPPARE